jgi:hypothetical protein
MTEHSPQVLVYARRRKITPGAALSELKRLGKPQVRTGRDIPTPASLVPFLRQLPGKASAIAAITNPAVQVEALAAFEAECDTFDMLPLAVKRAALDKAAQARGATHKEGK